MLKQLKKIINDSSVCPKKMKLKYSRMKKQSEELTNKMILKNEIPDGQGCAYKTGFPV